MPYLGSTVFVASLLAALLVATNAWWLLWHSLAPRFVERSRRRFERRPILSTLLGGVLGSFAAIVSIVLLSIEHPISKLIGMGLSSMVLAVALAGAAGLASRIGAGLSTDADPPWRALLRGGVVLELTFLLPVIGWLVVLPIALAGGLGAAVGAAFDALMYRAPHAQPA